MGGPASSAETIGRREVAVRVNAAGTAWHGDDLAAACVAGPDAILVPKVASAEQVPSRHTLLAALGTCLLAARARGKAILGSTTTSLTRPVSRPSASRGGGSASTARRSPPRQVDVCNRVLAPTAGQVADARAVIAAWEEAVARGRGVVTVDGRMVENLHVDAAHDAVQEFTRLGT
ncbi:MAG: hypothetical protein ACR2JN_12925 [Lapillicoccus sp.]